MKNNLNVIIVNYNSTKDTLKCINSIVKHNVSEVDDIIIVDNNSTDNTFLDIEQTYSNIKIIKLKENKGYSAGVNAAVAFCNHKYITILNPDTYFIDDSIKNAICLFDENEDIGIVGLELLNTDGTPQFSARKFYTWFDILIRRSFLKNISVFKKRIDNHLMCNSWIKNKFFDSDWVMGTGFIIKFDVFKLVGFMDESYFLYMEDVDLCARVWNAGFRVVALPGCKLIHNHNRKSNDGIFSFYGITHLKSLLTFVKKFHIPIYSINCKKNIIVKDKNKTSYWILLIFAFLLVIDKRMYKVVLKFILNKKDKLL